MSRAARKGLLIVFEGTDGTGKSTQLERVHRYLLKRDLPVIATREPTDGKHGKLIRELYHNRGKYSRREELQMFLDDRREHVTQLLTPALEDGLIILCDRYFLSTAAYQGAIGFNPDEILQLNAFAPDPDIALLFQMPLTKALDRIVKTRGETLNDFEKLESLKKVSNIFSSIKRDYITTIDASGTIEEVFHQVISKISPLLSRFTLHRV